MVTSEDLMTGINRACAYWQYAPNLQEQRRGLATAYDSGLGSVVDMAKGIVETVCKTILVERGVEFEDGDKFGKYLHKTLNALDLKNDRGSEQFQRVVGIFSHLGNEINNLRNSDCVVAHGKDGFLESLSDHQRKVALVAADSMIAFLFEAFRGLDTNLKETRAPYEKFKHLNEKIDSVSFLQADIDERTGTLEVFVTGAGEGGHFSFSPSQLLYELDRNAYVEVLRALDPKREKEPEPEETLEILLEELEVEESTPQTVEPPPEPETAPTPQDIFRRVPDYAGRYEDKIYPLFDVLSHEVGLDGILATEDINDLTKTILHGFEQTATIDWKNHPSGQARVRTFLKKVAKFYGLPADQFPVFMERMEDWLKVRLEV